MISRDSHTHTKKKSSGIWRTLEKKTSGKNCLRAENYRSIKKTIKKNKSDEKLLKKKVENMSN